MYINKILGFLVRGLLLEKGFWLMNTWHVPVQNWLEWSTLNFSYTFLVDCWTKGGGPIFEQLIIHFFQYFNKFCIETNEGILFKKIFKLMKIAGTLLYKCWFATFHGKKSYWKREFWLYWSLWSRKNNKVLAQLLPSFS